MICDWWILCVSVFQGSLLVIKIVIDGSEIRNCEVILGDPGAVSLDDTLYRPD